MPIQYGRPLPLDEITLAHVLDHPIWVWAWEAGSEEDASDETDQCPVLNTTDVTDSFTEAIITFKVKGTTLHGSASFIPELDRLEALSLWEGDTWVGLQEAAIPIPCTLVAVPTIRGVRDVEFLYDDPAVDAAERVSGT